MMTSLICTQTLPVVKRKELQLLRACKYGKNKNLEEIGWMQFSSEAFTDVAVKGCWQLRNMSDE